MIKDATIRFTGTCAIPHCPLGWQYYYNSVVYVHEWSLLITIWTAYFVALFHKKDGVIFNIGLKIFHTSTN